MEVRGRQGLEKGDVGRNKYSLLAEYEWTAGVSLRDEVKRSK